MRRILIEQGAIYHVTQRAPGKEKLFLEERDYLRFLHLLKITGKKFTVDFFCFALLSNHVHLLLRINKDNLSESMKFLFQSYAQSFNKKYKRKGHVFCGAYYASHCYDENYLLTASVYIHLNPLKAGLVTEAQDYRWSSLSPYVRPINSSFLNTDFILNMLSEHGDKARKLYEEFIDSGKNFDYGNYIQDNSAVKCFGRDFWRWVRDVFLKHNSVNSKNIYQYCEIEKKIEEISTSRFNNPETKKAFIYLVEQLKSRGYTYLDIANTLHMSRMSLYRLLREINVTKVSRTEM
jgi:putative transposase